MENNGKFGRRERFLLALQGRGRYNKEVIGEDFLEGSFGGDYMGAYETFASVYDLFMGQTEEDNRLTHIRAIWEKYDSAPRTILDLGCGTGSALLPLAQEGFDVIGVDLSPEMLAEADRKARENGVSVRLFCQDMTELELDEQADCILSLCDCMNYLTEEGQLAAALRRAAAHMKPEGLLLFDMNTEYKFREVLGQGSFGAAEERAAYIWENDYDAEEKINEYYVSFFIEREDGLYERVEEYHYERAYTTEEIERTLREAGLELLEVTDGYCFAAPHEKSERLLFVARLRQEGIGGEA